MTPESAAIVVAGAPLAGAPAAAILLHGRGRSTGDMLAVARAIDLPAMAWVALGAAGGSWYPQGFLAEVAENQPYLDDSLARVGAAVQMLEGEGIARRAIALVGFSQGACLASAFLYANAERWGALVAFTGGLIGPRGTSFPPRGELAGTPVLLATAADDTWVPLFRVSETAAAFRAMGGDVALRVRPGAEHVVAEEEVVAARAHLASLLREP